MASKPQLWEVHLLRVFAILAVIAIHTTGSPLMRLDKQSSMYGAYVFLNTFSLYAVPLFLLISGLVLFYSYLDKPCTREAVRLYYKKRITGVLIPYLVFSVFYFILNNYRNPEQLTSVTRFAYLVLTGRAHTHLYFMFIIIQFYILFPLFWAAARKIGVHIVWVCALLQVGYMFLNRYVIVHIQWLPNVVHRPASLSITYFAFFAFGGAMAMVYPQLKAWLMPEAKKQAKRSSRPMLRRVTVGMLYFLWLVNGALYVYLDYRGRTQGIYANSLDLYWIWCAHIILSALCFLGIAAFLLQKLPNRALRILINLGGCSFGIYLIHPFFLWLYRMLPFSMAPLAFHSFVLGSMLVALFVSWAITAFCLSRFKWARYAFGAAPQRYPQTPSLSTPHGAGKSVGM
jgi:surface polysaccharide O-acyltransferase-like enzyme